MKKFNITILFLLFAGFVISAKIVSHPGCSDPTNVVAGKSPVPKITFIAEAPKIDGFLDENLSSLPTGEFIAKESMRKASDEFLVYKCLPVKNPVDW